MNDLPKRPRSHVLETLSENYLRNQLPPEWILSKSNIDYGTDFNCEISIDNQVVGLNFSIQLKAKEKNDNEDFILIKDLKKSTINRWLKRLEPTIIIAYVEEIKEAYWIWIKDNSFDLTKKNKTFQIKIPKKNKLSTTDWNKVYREIEQIFSKRYLLYELPKEFSNVNEEEAWSLYFQQNFQLALLGFYELIKIDNKNPLLWNSIAVCEYQLFNYKKALIAINKAFQFRRDDFIRLNKASILTEYGAETNDRNLLELAIIEYDTILKKNISDSVLYNYANCKRALGEFEDAKEGYIKSLEINPNNAKAWKNLGSVYYNLNLHDLEIICYDNALELEPNLYEAQFSKGVTLFKVFGKTQQGLDLMLQGETSDKNKNFELSFPYVYFWISEAYLHLGEIENAIKWNMKGLGILPTDDYFLKQHSRIINNNL